MGWLVTLVHFLIVILVSPHILLHKRDSKSAALWLMTLWLMPVAGALLYWGFGINRAARKAKRRIHRKITVASDVLSKGSIRAFSGHEPLKKLGDSLIGYPLSNANQIQPLINGKQAYPAMLQAIAGARKSIALSSYIFDRDQAGEDFVRALYAAAKRGVAVRVLVDGIGAFGKRLWIQESLSEAGGKVASFWPRSHWMQQPGLNLRNHRKILVVDGRLGFAGGMNISSRHLAQQGEEPLSRDIHFSLRGRVVKHMMDVFSQDWENSCGESLNGPLWYPVLRPCGTMPARGVAAGPDQDLGKIYELFLGALRSAKKTVDIVTPYFIPDTGMIDSLRVAGKSGVKVRLFLPTRVDQNFMRWAARACLWELIDNGVEIWEIGGEFVHSKLLIVDNCWVLLGSSNMDPRSFRLNFEFNVEVYSLSLAAQLNRYLQGLLHGSTLLSHSKLEKENIAIKLRNQTAKLFSPYL